MKSLSSAIIQSGVDQQSDLICNTPSAWVNMRLYKANDFYREIIIEIIRLMDTVLVSRFSDSLIPMRGISAPTVGFPFRIIAFRKPLTSETQFCINPVITHASQDTITVNGKSPIFPLTTYTQAERHHTIDLTYCDLAGESHYVVGLGKEDGGFVIQHEMALIEGNNRKS